MSSRSNHSYTRFKYKGIEFKVGEICRFYCDKQPDLIGKITQIMSTDPNHKDFAKLKIQWVFQKKDLPAELRKDFITDDLELFLTNKHQEVYV